MKVKQAHAIEVKQLPAPGGGSMPTQISTFQKFCGLRMVGGIRGAAMFFGMDEKVPRHNAQGNILGGRAVVVHQRPRPLATMVNDYLDPNDWFVLLVRSVPKDLEPWNNRLRQLKVRRNGAYHDFISLHRATVWPDDERVCVGHDMIMWMDAKKVIDTDPQQPTARLNGHIVTTATAGAVLSAAIKGGPLYLEANPMNPWECANPGEIMFLRSMVLQGEWAVGYARGQMQYQGAMNDLIERISALKALGCDVLVRGEVQPQLVPDRDNPGAQKQVKTVHADIILRFFAPYEGEYGPKAMSPELDEYFRKLQKAKVGQWTRITRFDKIEECWRAYIPGSAPQSYSEYQHSLGAPDWTLHRLSVGTGVADQTGGNMCIGMMSGGLPTFRQADMHPSIGMVAESGSGKSTAKDLWFGLPWSPFAVNFLLQLNYREGALTWAGPERLNGTIMRFDGSNNSNPDLNDTRSYDEMKLAQERVADWARDDVARRRERWMKGDFRDLPIVFTRPARSSLLYFYLADIWTGFFEEAWTDVHQKHGALAWTGWEDLRETPLKNHAIYGELQKETGWNMLLRILELIDGGRKKGMHTLWTAHTVAEFAAYPDGLLESTSLVYLLKPGYMADVWDPRAKVVQQTVSLGLEEPILDWSGFNGR